MASIHNNTRRRLYASLFVGYSTYYFARMSYIFAKPALLRDMNFDKNQLGVISSGFAACYGVSKFVGGLISDRVSSKVQFSLGLLLTGALNIALGFTSSLWLFTLLWSLNGLFQGFGWPPCTKLLRVWFLPTEVGTLWSLLTAGSNFVAGISPILTTYLTTHYSWSAAFTVPGALAMSLSGVTYFCICDHPSDVGLGSCSKDQASTNDECKIDSSKKVPLHLLLASPFLWMLCCGYFLIRFLQVGINDWVQLYLIQAKQKAEYDAGIAVSMFQIGGMVGSIVSGCLSDRMMKYGAGWRSSPRMPVLIGFVVVQIVGLYLLCHATGPASSLWFLALIIFGLGFSMFGPINIFGVLAVECAPAGLTGTAHAIVALAANVGAVFGGYPLSMLVKLYGWDEAFFFMEITSVFMLIFLVSTRNLSSKMVDTSKLE